LALFDWGGYRKYFEEPQMARLLAQWLCFAFSFTTLISGFALFCERQYTWHGRAFGPKEVGYVMAYSGFLGIIMQGGMVGRMVKWMGEKNVVRVGFATSAVSYAMIGLSRTVPQLLAVNTISAVGGSGLRPALTSLITQKADRREQGVVIGLTQSLMSIAQITAPLIGTLLIQEHLLVVWACWAGLFCAIGLLLG
jgi:MFS family permease